MLERLNKLFDEGLLMKQHHPHYDLTIWNYSPVVQYHNLWEKDSLLMECRGLVTNSKGDVVARPFKKFKNFEEYTTEEIPNEPFEVFSKMDGSLGIVFYYNNEWIIATRGSFTSEQAIMGKKMMDEKYNTDNLDKNFTYLFEIIY